MSRSLAQTHRKVTRQWHPEANGELEPRDVTARSRRVVWWRCSSGHEWTSPVYVRAKGVGCPRCVGRFAGPENCLATVRPDLAKQWHPRRNAALGPEDVTTGSSVSVWWRCPKNRRHLWRGVVRNRARGVGCPHCAGRSVKNRPMLPEERPDLAREWHPTKNAPLTAADVTAGSSRGIWWRCAEGHEWQAVVYSRTHRRRPTGCPFCSGRRPTVDRSLAVLRPDLAAEWHPTRNPGLRPEDVSLASNRPVWWQCDVAPDHVWRTVVTSRAGLGTGCPVCAGRKVTPTTSLAYLHPDITASLDPDKNGALDPTTVLPGTTKKLWWRCPKGPDHVWEAMVRSRVAGRGCPFCGRRRVSRTASLAALHPEVAALWHPDKNGDVTPESLLPRVQRYFWWKCDAGPDHEWRSRPYDFTAFDHGCPFCAGHRASVTNSLGARWPDLAAQWHPTKNEGLTPDDVLPGSSAKIWWSCPEGDDHVWRTAACARTSRPTGCPFCSGFRVSKTNCLATLYPKVAAMWHPTLNGDVTPSDITSGRRDYQWWQCPKGPDHVFEKTPYELTRFGTRCPFCAGRRVSTTNCLETEFPEIAEQWHRTKNGSVTPRDVFSGDKTHVWWSCPRRHAWRASVRERTALGRGCHQCAMGG